MSTFLCIVRFGGQKVSLKSDPKKRAAKTIILHSCDVENCEDTSATIMERGEIQRKRRTYCVAGAPNDISYTKNTHIPSIPVHYFPKDIAVWPKWMRFDRCHRGDFTLHYQCLMLCTGFEDGCYEHIPLVKSGEDNQ